MVSTKQIGFAVSIVMALVAVAAQGSLHLPLGVPESWGPIIQSWSSFIMAIYLVINPFLPSDVVGPLKPSPDDRVLVKDTAVDLPKGTTVTKP